jgi:RNA polymerase sigma-70 factor (ECF subfamily)
MLESDARDGHADQTGDGAVHGFGTADSVARKQALRDQIEALLPRLTRFARVLTRDVVAADDLVQDCVARALVKIHLWEPGTDLRAWLFAILHSQHVNTLRRDARHRAGIDRMKAQRASSSLPDQHSRLELRDVERALAHLPESQRSLILLVGLQGMGYQDAASAANIPLGTVRSRVGRGRETLRWLTDRPSAEDRRAADKTSVDAATLRSALRRGGSRNVATKPVSGLVAKAAE